MKSNWNFYKKAINFFMTYQWRNNKPIIFVKVEIFHWKWLRLYWFWLAKLQRQNDRNKHQTYPKQAKIDGPTRSSSIETNRKRDLSRNSNQQQQEEDETAFRINEEMQLKILKWCLNDEWLNQWREVSPKYITVDLSLHTSLIGKPNKFLMLSQRLKQIQSATQS